jgi:hypothetical protein
MSNKIGLIFFLMIFFIAFVLCLDIATVQLKTSKLIIESNYVSSLIIKNRGINREVREFVNEVMQGELTCISGCTHIVDGTTLKYQIVISYTSIFKQEEKNIKIERQVLFGTNI